MLRQRISKIKTREANSAMSMNQLYYTLYTARVTYVCAQKKPREREAVIRTCRIYN